MLYHFCSAHCLERFNDIPALYTGSRRIADILPNPETTQTATGERQQIGHPTRRPACRQNDRVTSVTTEKTHLLVEYDLRKTILSQIETVATAEGLQFKDGFHGFRRRLWKLTEASELENAAQPGPGACCNRPPTRLR